jgi:hypothetical protein
MVVLGLVVLGMVVLGTVGVPKSIGSVTLRYYTTLFNVHSTSIAADIVTKA